MHTGKDTCISLWVAGTYELLLFQACRQPIGMSPEQRPVEPRSHTSSSVNVSPSCEALMV